MGITKEHRLQRRAGRQAVAGVVIGMVGALLLKGYVPLPVSSVHAAMNGGGMAEIVAPMQEGSYRVVMHCRMKNHRVGYHVKADHPGAAHMALEWLMPACKLSGLGGGEEAEGGQRWYTGEFVCQGNTFKKTQTVRASNLREARERAAASASGCRTETIDQTACPTLDPLCDRQSEDFKVEAELERHRLLR